ncbi:retrovirus-related pol polyprotein from transposon TNT 1-94 [Tanacetum coccineum]
MNRNKPVEQKSFAKKPERQIPKGHRFSIKKTSVVHEKIMTPRYCLRWKSTGNIFKAVGLRWVPTGKIFTSSTTKVDSETPNSSNEDITNQNECEQTLNVSTGTLNLSAGTSFNPKKEGLRVCSELGIHDHNNEPSNSKLVPKVAPPTDKTTTSRQEKANVSCYNCNEKGHYVRDCQKPRVRDAKYFSEQMLLAMKDEAGSNLNDKENNFMLDTSYEKETMQELTVAVILMARIQRKAEIVPSYDAKAVMRILKEKDKIQSDFFKIKNEKIIIQHETQLAKKVFKDQENRYLEDIIVLEEKLSSHDRIVYKMGQLIQTIHMLGKKPNKVYGPFLKAGLGYKNPERLKKANTAQPKIYDGEMLHSAIFKTDSSNSEETLEDAEESRLKMRNKMVQINYGN